MNPSVAYFHQHGITLSRAELAIVHNQQFLDQLLTSQLHIPTDMQPVLLRRRCEFVAGRWCAMQAMKQLGLNKIHQPNIGKYNEPIWPNNVVGSISHTNDTAVAIAMRPNKHAGAIGVDRENIMEPQLAGKFAKKIMSLEELTFNSYFSGHALFVTTIFSSKEALFKAMFAQIERVVDFSVAQVSHIDNKAQIIELTLTQTLSQRLVAGRKINVLYTLNKAWVETYTVI